MGAGLAGDRLQDGICVTDRLVQAPADVVVAHYGIPLLVARDGVSVVDGPPSGVRMWVASCPDSPWTVVEPPDDLSLAADDGDDYLAPLFDQGIAALQGRIPTDLPAVYENPLGAVAQLTAALGCDGVALWGSDEWAGICGGAHLSGGTIRRAFSAFSVEEIGRCATARRAMSDGAPDEDDLDDILDRASEPAAFVYSPDSGVETLAADVMSLLDAMLVELGAGQPFAPITLWGDWPERGEIWAALAPDA